MPSTRPTVDPVLDILEELGYDFDELDGDGYKRSLKEAIIKLTIKDPKDPRIGILTLEFQKVKGSRKVEPKEKRTVIRGDKLMGREPKKDAPSPTAGKPKLLTGVGKFNTDDVKPADVDKKQKDSSDLKPDKLDSIAKTVESIALLLRRQFNLEKKQQRDSRRQQSKADRDAREDKLEGKPKDKKTGLIPKAIKKPALNFFEKIKNFFLNIAIGSAVFKMLDWLKDPANAEKIAKFSEFLINNAPAILIGLTAISLLPTILTVVSVVKGILAGLSLLGPLLPALPWILGGILVGAVAWWIGKKLFVADDEVVEASKNLKGDISSQKDVINKATEKGKPLLDPRPNATWLVYPMGHALQGKPLYSRNWQGNKKWKGAADAFEDPSGESKGRKFLIYPWTLKADGTTWGNKAQIDLATKRETALDQFETDSKQMKQDVKTARTEAWHKLRDERAASEELKALRAMEKGKERTSALKDYENETLRLKKIVQKEAEEKVKAKFAKDQAAILKNSSSFNIDKESSSATIDKNIKKETNISPPNTKGKGSTTIINGGGGQQQSVGGGGGGTTGSSAPSFSSQDPNNLGTFSTQGMYNMVG